MKFSHGWMSDTHPDALRVYLDIHARTSPERKLAQLAEMYDAITALQTAEVRRLYPAATDREVFLRVTARRLGTELLKEGIWLATRSLGRSPTSLQTNTELRPDRYAKYGKAIQ